MGFIERTKKDYQEGGVLAVLNKKIRKHTYFYRDIGRQAAIKILKLLNTSTTREELKGRAERYLEYGEEGRFHPPRPSGPEPIPAELQEKNRELTDPQPFVCELSNVELVGKHTLPIDREGRYILEDTEGCYGRLSDTIFEIVRDGQLPIRREADSSYKRPIANFGGFYSGEFYHWFADYLPRVRGLEVYAEETGTYPDVLLPRDVSSWQLKSLDLVGVPEERLVQRKYRRSCAERYVVSSIPGYAHHNRPSWGNPPSPKALQWVADRILDETGIEHRSDNRIFISRRDASYRRIRNEEEVIETLSSYGFEPVVLSELPLVEQVRLFAHAEAVVAPHGAGLTNMIYGEDLKILELFGKKVIDCYYCLAGGLNFKYQYEWCDGVEQDMIADTNSIESSVESLLEQ